MGDRHLDLADNLAAERAYRQALALEPNDVPALNNLGCALLAQKRKTEATLAFKSALLLDPTMSEAKGNTHETMRGLVGSATTRGVLALVAASVLKFKILWLWVLARQLLEACSREGAGKGLTGKVDGRLLMSEMDRRA